MDIIEEYRYYCLDMGIPFSVHENVRSYDETTLFCPAGMQPYKKIFKDESVSKTIANVQSCIRLNDLDLIGDGTHLIHFRMLGLFSFRDWSIQQAIDFWMRFIVGRLDIRLTCVDVHPDMQEWSSFYEAYGIEVRMNDECTWSDGGIGGYCTEFFVGDVEIGNIVNPLGTCIDVGFGLERLNAIVNGTPSMTKKECLVDAIKMMELSGFEPSNIGQGFILNKLKRKVKFNDR